jgi:hypothetical protein
MEEIVLCNSFSQNYADVFYMIDKEYVPSYQCKTGLDRSTAMKEMHDLSFILIDFNIKALTPRLHCSFLRTKTSLRFVNE